MQSRERRTLLQRGYALGKARALRVPTERNDRLALIRSNLRLVSDQDRYCLLAELAINDEGLQGLIRATALLLGGID